MNYKNIICVVAILIVFTGCGEGTSSQMDTEVQSVGTTQEEIPNAETQTVVNNEAVSFPQGVYSAPTEQISTQ